MRGICVISTCIRLQWLPEYYIYNSADVRRKESDVAFRRDVVASLEAAKLSIHGQHNSLFSRHWDQIRR
jgi:hypothetical protein